MLFIIGLLFAVVIGLVLGRLTAPEPKPAPAPAPKRFGLEEAEAVSKQLGGMTPTQATAAAVAAMVGGMDYTVAEDVKATRAELAGETGKQNQRINSLRSQIRTAEGVIAANNARDTEVSTLGQAFGVTA